MRPCVNATDHLAFTGGHPLSTGLESTNSGATGLTHDRGAFGHTVSTLHILRETRHGWDRPTSKTVATEEGSKSTWRATGRGGYSGVTLADISIG